MPEPVNIESVHEIDGVNVASPIDLSEDITKRKVEGNYPDMVFFGAEKDGFWHKAIKGFISTIAGENKLGKGLGAVKDAISYFAPAAKIIDAITDPIGDALKTKQQTNTIMKNQAEKLSDKAKRFILQPSTQAGISFALMVVGGIWSGVHIDASTLSNSVVGVLTALAGVYTAVTNLINIFHDEAKSPKQ